MKIFRAALVAAFVVAAGVIAVPHRAAAQMQPVATPVPVQRVTPIPLLTPNAGVTPMPLMTTIPGPGASASPLPT